VDIVAYRDAVTLTHTFEVLGDTLFAIVNKYEAGTPMRQNMSFSMNSTTLGAFASRIGFKYTY